MQCHRLGASSEGSRYMVQIQVPVIAVLIDNVPNTLVDQSYRHHITSPQSADGPLVFLASQCAVPCGCRVQAQ